MHLNAQRPIFVPDSCFPELDKLSKAAWMDIAWDLETVAETSFLREDGK